MFRSILVVLALTAAVAVPPQATITDLTRVDELEALFDADVGKTRIVLLLSPR